MIDTAFIEGKQAAQDGKPKSANPYGLDIDKAVAWADGHDRANGKAADAY